MSADKQAQGGGEVVAWTVFDAKGIRFTLYNRELAEAIAERGLLVLPMFGRYEWLNVKNDCWTPIDRLPYTWERELGVQWRERTAPPSAPVGKRPSRDAAEIVVSAYLLRELGVEPSFTLAEDGDDAWAFWITEDGAEGDTTSYLHADFRVEWLGTSWEPSAPVGVEAQCDAAECLMGSEHDWTVLDCPHCNRCVKYCRKGIDSKAAWRDLTAENKRLRDQVAALAQQPAAGEANRWVTAILAHVSGLTHAQLRAIESTALTALAQQPAVSTATNEAWIARAEAKLAAQRPATVPLTADFAMALLDGTKDTSTLSDVEDALDKIEAPTHAADGRWLTLPGRILALQQPAAVDGAVMRRLEGLARRWDESANSDKNDSRRAAKRKCASDLRALTAALAAQPGERHG